MKIDKLTRFLPVFGLAVLLALLAALPVLANGVTTVCPEGPPTCDYAAIQEGVDAAGAGDTVLVGPGVYTEQVALKSDITVSSTHGALSTTVTYPYGPIISATNALSVRLQGIGVRGQAEMSPALGIQLVQSSVVISDCRIKEIYGVFDAMYSPGNVATAIQAEGGTLLVDQTTITSVQGGRCWEWEGDLCASAGDTFGIRSTNTELTVTQSDLSNLLGGDGGGLAAPLCPARRCTRRPGGERNRRRVEQLIHQPTRRIGRRIIYHSNRHVPH